MPLGGPEKSMVRPLDNCQSNFTIWRMIKPFLRCFTTVAAGLLAFNLTSCSGTKKTGFSHVVDYTTPNTDLSQSEYPFDEKGNYLSDVVSGKKKGSTNSKVKPAEPPKSYVDTFEKPPESTPAASASPNYETPPASDPYASVTSSGSTATSSQRTKPSTAESERPKPNPKPEPEVAAKPKPKPKPKPEVAAKPKPKPKPAAPAAISYTVQKGDTLYKLANRYGTSVAAIKSASGLTSDTLRDGKTIKIPRK
jgi:LysM repeat protein